MALYNKFRPLSWDAVIGQDGTVETLKNAVSTNRVVSTYMFTGPKGTGKTTCARILAKALNCENLIAPGVPCGVCETCQDIASDQTHFVIEYDGASKTGIDDMREIKQSVNMATMGKWKVYIIDECHMLSKAAQNSALKMFEEPPEKVIFILCTTELNKVEGTITSRCQRYDFRPITVEHIINRLQYICEQEKIQADNAALKIIAKAAHGGMRDSISILEKVSLESANVVNVQNVVRSLGVAPVEVVARIGEVIVGNHKSAFEIVGNIIDNGYDIYQFLQSSVDYFRDVLLLKIGLDQSVFVDADTLVSMKATAGSVENNKISESIKILEETMNKYKFTDNKRILVEIAFYKISSLGTVGIANTVVEQTVNPSTVEQLVRAVLGGVDFSQYIKQPMTNTVYQEQPVQQPQVQQQYVAPQQNSVPMQVPQNLTEWEWNKYLEIMQINDEMVFDILLKMCAPVGFEGKTLVIGVSDFFSFYASMINEEYSIICSKVLSQCMNQEVFVKAIVLKDTPSGHNTQATICVTPEKIPNSSGIQEFVQGNTGKEQVSYENMGNSANNQQVVDKPNATQSFSGAPVPQFQVTPNVNLQESVQMGVLTSNVPLQSMPVWQVGNDVVFSGPPVNAQDSNAPVTADMLHGVFGFGNGR